MKKLLLILFSAVILVACSPTKYTYYFDRYSTKGNASIVLADTSGHVHEKALLASTSKGILASIEHVPTEFETEIKTTSRSRDLKAPEAKVFLRQTGKELKATLPDGQPNYGKKFVIFGIVLMIVGIVAWPLLIIGALWIVKGKKMKKRAIEAANQGTGTEQLERDRYEWRHTMAVMGLGLLAAGLLVWLLWLLLDGGGGYW